MQSDIQNLINIGLSEKEAIIYLTLATVGKSSAYKLAQKSKVKLPTVYINIETLIQKGLIIRIPNVNKQIFIHQSLENYLDKIGNSINYSRNLDNKLKKENTNKNPSTKYFEGFSGIKEAVDYRFKEFEKEDEFWHIYGGLEPDVKKEIMDFYIKWDFKVIKNGIISKTLLNKNNLNSHKEIIKLKNNINYEIKTLETINLPKNLSLEINNKFVRIISTKPPEATIIEDEKLVEILKQLFKELWIKAEELVI